MSYWLGLGVPAEPFVRYSSEISESCYFSVIFFSSRRRHTRWPRDWSSDVCSSDLADQQTGVVEVIIHGALDAAGVGLHQHAPPQIGRASCRERVEAPAVGRLQ